MAKSKISKEVTLNLDQKLFVIPCMSAKGRVIGYSCLGFENCYQKTVAIVNWLNADTRETGQTLFYGLPDENDKASLAAYKYYSDICREGARLNELTGKRCDAELIPELVGLEGRKVMVTDCHGDVRTFRVGKSTGWFPCHLEIEAGEIGGGCVYGAPFQKLEVIAEAARRWA